MGLPVLILGESGSGKSTSLRNFQKDELVIYNVAGKCIKTFKVEGPDRQYELNLPKGIYIVKVGNTARRITVK